MATALAIITSALQEIGVAAQGQSLSAANAETCLERLQNLIDAWAADRLTIFNETRVTASLTSGTSTRTIGPTGQIVTTRPEWIRGINYVIPGSSPAVETPMGPMDDDAYMNLSIKTLSSSLPTEYYYNNTVPNGTLTFWPVVNQTVSIAIYFPLALGQPTTLLSSLTGPPGYQEAFRYQLALRLCTPFSRQTPPLLPQMATDAYARIKRANTEPGLLGVDAALTPSYGGAYNVLNDSYTGSR